MRKSGVAAITIIRYICVMAKQATADDLSKQINVLQNQLFIAKAHF
jgi:hypothetical protein